jgi:pilus assembly protein Flp/PilA
MIDYINKLKATRREEGASAVEYGLMVAAIAAVIVVLVFGIGSLVQTGFNTTCTEIADNDSSAATTAAGDCT